MSTTIAPGVVAVALVISMSSSRVRAQPIEGQLVLSAYSLNRGVWYGSVGKTMYVMKRLSASYHLNAVRTVLGNVGVVCADASSNRIFRFDQNGSAYTLAALPAGIYATGIELDQDGSYVITAQDRVFRVTGSSILTLSAATGAWNAITRDRDTGDFVLGDRKSGKLVQMERLTGALTTLTGSYGSITGLAYNPWNGSFAVTRENSTYGLAIVQRTGSVKQLPFSEASCVTVDPKIGSVWAASLDGKIIHTDASGNVIASADVGDHRFTGIDIWGDQNASLRASGFAGTDQLVTLQFDRSKKAPYYCALSLGNRPGIPLGGSRTLFLQPDRLFFVTASTSLPGLTKAFAGTLDDFGFAWPRFRLPSFLPRGLLLHFGAVAVNTGFPGNLDMSNTECIKVR